MYTLKILSSVTVDANNLLNSFAIWLFARSLNLLCMSLNVYRGAGGDFKRYTDLEFLDIAFNSIYNVTVQALHWAKFLFGHLTF